MRGIFVEESYLAEIEEKARKYDAIKSANAKKARAGNQKMTAEQRSARAKKAVEARIAKYGQQRRK